jgi:hypothetical protein
MRVAPLLAGAGIVAASLIGLGGTANAAGACPTGDGWTLAPTEIFIDQLDNGNVADQNGDGLACFRVNQGQTDKHGGIPSYTWKDNTN